MLLVLDNYDSFTYNLVQYAGELGAEPVVYRNDALTPEEALALRPAAIVISPGPCTPREAGISVPLVRAAAGRVPVLGVCLGHQAIGEAFGGRVVRADRLMHGKTTHGGAHRAPALSGHSLTRRGDALPLAGRLARAALPAELEVDRLVQRPCPRAGDHGPLSPHACRSTGSSFTPSRSPPCRANGSSPTFLPWPESPRSASAANCLTL